MNLNIRKIESGERLAAESREWGVWSVARETVQRGPRMLTSLHGFIYVCIHTQVTVKYLHAGDVRRVVRTGIRIRIEPYTVGTTESLERVDRLEYICTLSYTPVLRLSYAGLTLFTRHAASRDTYCVAHKKLYCVPTTSASSLYAHIKIGFVPATLLRHRAVVFT